MEKELSQKEILFQQYYNEIPGVAVSIITNKLSEAVEEINKQLKREIDLLDFYRCTSFAMIGAIETLNKEHEITDERRMSIVEKLAEFLDEFTSEERPMKELYVAPHILADMISFMAYQQFVEDTVEEE